MARLSIEPIKGAKRTITVEGEIAMFKGAKALLVAALLAVSVVACTGVQAQPQAQAGKVVQASTAAQSAPETASPQPQRSITVVGSGKVSLVPDIATINVGAEALASTVSEAKSTVDAQMAAITAALEELGVAKKDIQTSHYGIHYEREPFMPGGRAGAETAGAQGAYRVSNMLRVTVRDVEQAGNVLDAVVAAGANQVYGVTFTVSDDSAWQSEARAKAVADAQARAEELATLAEVELGDVLTISEVIGGGPVPMAFAERAMGGGGGIAPGEMEMSTQVQVTFAIQ
jgi:uncharacterized protein YggE